MESTDTMAFILRHPPFQRTEKDIPRGITKNADTTAERFGGERINQQNGISTGTSKS